MNFYYNIHYGQNLVGSCFSWRKQALICQRHMVTAKLIRLCRKRTLWKTGRARAPCEPSHIPHPGDAHAHSHSCKCRVQLWGHFWPDPIAGRIRRRCLSWTLQDHSHLLCHLHGGEIVLPFFAVYEEDLWTSRGECLWRLKTRLSKYC